jgi:hypothetical protein
LNSQPEAVLLVEELRNDPRVRALSSLDRVLTDQTVSITEVASGRVEDDENTHLEARTSETDLATAFDRQLKELVVEFPSKARSSAALKTVAYGWLEDIWAEQGDEAHADGVRALLLDPVLGEQSRAFLREAASACFAGLTRTPRQRKDYTFAFPERVFWPDKGCKVLAADNVCAKHLYTGPTGNATITTPTLSDPEQRFIEQIAGWVRDEKVEWWWKNGEAASVEGNTKFFSIAYTSTAGDASSTYPDFLVRFTSGLLAVLEAKDPELKDPESRAKAAALAAWQPKGVLAGVVYQRGTTWMLATTLDPIDDVELAPLLP